MNNKTILAALLSLIAVTGQAKTYRTIKEPVSMACLNVWQGNLSAREVIMRDTATIIRFTLDFPKGRKYRIAKDSYLTDEDGNRYALRFSEGVKAGSQLKSPENGVTDFTLYFEPMPKRVQVFDFVNGDGNIVFKLIGIHDKKAKLNIPTLEELSAANPYALPADWLKTDTITIRGRIEGYDVKAFGFTSMECYYRDMFEKEDATLVLEIAPDGTFEKKFRAGYPVLHSFHASRSRVSFYDLPFFARPGETIDITVRPSAYDRHECIYSEGSSKELEHWFKERPDFKQLTDSLSRFNGTFSEARNLAEQTWLNMMYFIGKAGRRNPFTPLETQIALSEAQVDFAFALMEFTRHREIKLKTREMRDGKLQTVISDSAEWNALLDFANYRQLQHVDFDNPMLLACKDYKYLINRIEYAEAIRNRKYAGLLDEYGGYHMNARNGKKALTNLCEALRNLTGSDHETLMAQICIYQSMLSHFNGWRMREELTPRILADTTRTEAEHEAEIADLESHSNMMPAYLAVYNHPYVHWKAEQFYADKMAQKELTTPLPDNNPAADLIRSLSEKYPGRFLMIDFWGMGCGPCRLAIQNSKAKRAEIAGREDIKLVFIAGERTAGGSDAYREYVAKWLADEETVCVSEADFTRLQELFRFNGIPHYETISPDGSRVRDDLSIKGFYNFNNDLSRLIDRLK